MNLITMARNSERTIEKQLDRVVNLSVDLEEFAHIGVDVNGKHGPPLTRMPTGTAGARARFVPQNRFYA